MYFPLFSVKSIHNVSCTAEKRFGMGQAHMGSLSFRVGTARDYGVMARGEGRGSELVVDEGRRRNHHICRHLLFFFWWWWWWRGWRGRDWEGGIFKSSIEQAGRLWTERDEEDGMEWLTYAYESEGDGRDEEPALVPGNYRWPGGLG
jgi:hypothetical protein